MRLAKLFTRLVRGVWYVIVRVIEHRCWYTIAQLSYSAYMLHLYLIALIDWVVYPEIDWEGAGIDVCANPFLFLDFAFLMVVTLLVSTITFALVERPFMDMRHLVRGKDSLSRTANPSS